MTYEQKIRILLERIANNDCDFSDEDCILIKRDVELRKAIFKKLSEGVFEISDVAVTELFEWVYTYQDEVPNLEECICNWFYMVCYYDKTLETDIINEIAEVMEMSDETYNRLNETVNVLLSDPSFDPLLISGTDFNINALLNNKRYDLFSKIHNLNISISESTIDRIFAEYPFQEYGIPQCVLELYKMRFKPEDYPTRELISYATDKLISYRYHSQNVTEEEMTHLKKLVIERIHKLDDLRFLNDDYSLYSFVYELEDEESHYLAEEVINKGYVLAILSVHRDDRINALIKLIESGEGLTSKIVSSMVDENLLANPTIRAYVFGNCMFNELLENNKIAVLQPYEDEIVEQVRTNTIYREKLKVFELYPFMLMPKVLDALIECKIPKEINLSGAGGDRIDNFYLRAMEAIPDVSIFLPPSSSVKVQILAHETKNHRYSNIIYGSEIGTIIEEHPEAISIVKEALHNYYVALKILDGNSKIVLNNEELFNVYFTDPLLCEIIVDHINHDESLDHLYNMDIYNKLKPYFMDKYKLKEENLDLMVNSCGPRIVRYIDNPNIRQILSLSKEELQKVLDLFPKVEYTLDDVNAAYDSLTQFSFGKYNPEKITIFPRFLHAIEDNALEELNDLRETLIINTKLDFLERIKEKYKLPNINDTGELLDLIINEIRNNSSKLHRDILHDLTDEYISNERTNFRNNRYFDSLYPTYSNVFSNLYRDILKGVDVHWELSELEDYMTKDFYNKIREIMPITEELEFPPALLQYVVEKVKNPETRNRFLPNLKFITDYYYNAVRNEHLKEISIFRLLSLPYNIEEKNRDRVINDYIFNHLKEFEVLVENDNLDPPVEVPTDIVDVIVENSDGKITKEIIYECLEYIKGNHNFLMADEQTLKKAIPVILKIIDKFVKENKVIWNFIEIPKDNLSKLRKELDENFRFKRQYYLEPNTADVYSILMNIDIKILRKNVLNDEEVYNKLLTIMRKKKLHCLPKYLDELLEDSGITPNLSNIAGFMSFFKTILENERTRLASNGKNPDDALTSLATILLQADIYSSLSSVYPQILGQEDAMLIKANPKPNDAIIKTEDDQRLKESVANTITLFKRKVVTIPTFDKDYEVDKDKKLNAVVGNMTDSTNLTHGERTGACMRIGGVGESLYNFCINNPNGFHIRFEDPETHDYVSRVSGFRNGNTVFLNELRCSCKPKKYSDYDVVECCRRVAEDLIKLSADSTCPIENVVISKEYAMSVSKLPLTDLGVKNIKVGLPKFYSDVDNRAVVLATTNPPYKKINFDKSNVPEYLPCRGKIYKTNNKKLLANKINRVASINAILNGTNYEELDRLDFPDGLVYGIVSDDWYIYINSNREVKYDYIKEDPRALEELTTHIEEVEQLLANNQIEEENDYAL